MIHAENQPDFGKECLVRDSKATWGELTEAPDPSTKSFTTYYPA